MRKSSGYPVAVVGAGVAGLACARKLRELGAAVEVLEAQHSIGGRCFAVASPFGALDAGCAAINGQKLPFLREVDRLVRLGSLAPWHLNSYSDQPEDGSPEEEDDIRPPRRIGYVGVPALTSLPRFLAQGLPVQLGFEAESIQRKFGNWFVRSAGGILKGPYDQVVLAMPAPRSLALARNIAPLERALAAVRYDPCWVLLMSPRSPIRSNLVQRTLSSGPIRWVGGLHRQPARSRSQVWALHASASWSAARLECDADLVCAELVDLLSANLASSAPSAWLHAQLWRHAFRADHNASAPDYFWSDTDQIGICGDSVSASSIEAVFLSGQQLALRMVEQVGRLQAA